MNKSTKSILALIMNGMSVCYGRTRFFLKKLLSYFFSFSVAFKVYKKCHATITGKKKLLCKLNKQTH